MPTLTQVKDIMTRDVLTVKPDDSLELLADLFNKYDYDGIPVVDDSKTLLGIVTGYDMVVQSSGLHLPTVLNIMKQIAVDRADKKELDAHFARLRQIKVSQVMNNNPLTITPEAALDEAAKLFAEHHRVNPLCVSGPDGKLQGLLSRYDIIRFFNQSYFLRSLASNIPVANVRSGPDTKQTGLTAPMGDITKQFMLVTKGRPLVWRYLAIAAFIAGMAAATAAIIRIVTTSP